MRSFPFAVPEGLAPPAEYDELPRLAPVRLPNGDDAVLATRYDDVKAVLADGRFSRSAYSAPPLFARKSESLPLLTSDPPDHGRRRRAVTHAFTARAARQSRAALEQRARDLLRAMRAAGPDTDLVEAFTLPFPMLVMCDLLGVPAGDRHQLRPWVDAMMSTSGFPPDQVAAAHEQMNAYFTRIVAAKAAEPDDDLLSEMLASPDLSTAEVVTLGSGLLMAGYETTSNQLTTCAYLLLRDPSLAAELRRDPAAVIEEMLRWTSFNATGGIPHVATEDVPLGDAVIRAGEVVVPLTDAANRDPDAFTDPGRIDAGRRDRAHVAFGHGRHYCLGAHLARAELEVGLVSLLAEFPDLALAVSEDQLRWRQDMFIRGLWGLPVRWEVTQ
jgi:nocardicin N-oxygenase